MSLRAPVVFSENPGSKLLPQRGSPSPARGWQAHPGIGRRVCFPWKPRMPQRKPSTGQQRPALLSSVLNFGSAFGPAPCSCGAPLRERATLGPMRAGGSRKPPDMPRSGRRGLSCRWAKHGPPVGRMLFASKGRKKRWLASVSDALQVLGSPQFEVGFRVLLRFKTSDSSSHSSSHTQNGQRDRILIIESVKTKSVIAASNISQDHGYIRGYRFHQNTSNKLQILLKYKNQKPAINKIIRISKPSKRVYSPISQLRKRNKVPIPTTGKSHSLSQAGRDHSAFTKGSSTPSTSKGV